MVAIPDQSRMKMKGLIRKKSGSSFNLAQDWQSCSAIKGIWGI
jgi:hypothetical protein